MLPINATIERGATHKRLKKRHVYAYPDERSHAPVGKSLVGNIRIVETSIRIPSVPYMSTQSGVKQTIRHAVSRCGFSAEKPQKPEICASRGQKCY